VIRLHRDRVPIPDVLNGPDSLGGRATKVLCGAVERRGGWHPPKTETGRKKLKSAFDFDKDIYGHKDVKNALIAMQHGKCAYCESSFLHVSPGDVEHFRPKAGYRQEVKSELSVPGYYWLAYQWENLLLSCEECNRRHKANWFPLKNPARRRTLDHRTTDLTVEQPLFLDPSVEYPSKVLEFGQHVVRPRTGQTARGRAVIQGLGLDRTRLNEARLARLMPLKSLLKFVKKSPRTAWGPEERDALQILRDAVRPTADYSAMVTCYFKAVGFDPDAFDG
jgi:uncharacterized protein (TIGR02646 family)